MMITDEAKVVIIQHCHVFVMYVLLVSNCVLTAEG